MGSPGTFGLSFQKAQKIRNLMASSGAVDAEAKPAAEIPKSARARKFFGGLLADRDWGGLLSGPEWRTAAKLLTALVAEARVNATQRRLGEWVDRKGFVGETALIRLGNQLLAKLDDDLPERDAIGFELSSYALRRTVDELYGPGRSPFDVDRDELLRSLPKIDTDTALKTYVASYLQELVGYLRGGLPPPTTAGEGRIDSAFLSVQQEQVPKLAQELLSTLREYSRERYGRTKPLTEMLDDVPDWLSAASRKLFKKEND
jgi:hypothetical protein